MDPEELIEDEDDGQRIARAIQENGTGHFQGVLTGFVLVAEWADLEGRRWLTRLHGNGHGALLPDWQVHGYLHNALHTPWNEAEDEDEPE